MSTSAAMMADFTSGCSGFMMADDIPFEMAIDRNVPVMTLRLGNPKLTFDAPHVVFTPSSVTRRRNSANTWRPAVAMAPMGITSGSTMMSLAGMP